MKKKKIILFALLAFVSCTESEKTISTEKGLTIEVKSPELDFYGIPNKSLSNIVVGDMLKVNLEISKLKGVDIVEIKPMSKAATFHELLNTDYELYTLSTTETGKYTKVESLIMKQGVNVFYVKPLVAGTFQIKLEEATKTFDLASTIVFSAVKIATRIEENVDGNCGLHKWRRHTYWFSIDAGSQTYDLLLKDDAATYTYETSYRSTSNLASFSANKELKVIGDKSECGEYPSVNNTINWIKITKTVAGISQIVATYYDVDIK